MISECFYFEVFLMGVSFLQFFSVLVIVFTAEIKSIMNEISPFGVGGVFFRCEVEAHLVAPDSTRLRYCSASGVSFRLWRIPYLKNRLDSGGVKIEVDRAPSLICFNSS